MLGRNARARGRQDLQLGEVNTAATPMHHLYRRLFPAVLRLAVDLEQVTRQLFAPLATQVEPLKPKTLNPTPLNPKTLNVKYDGAADTKRAVRAPRPPSPSWCTG